MILFPVMDFRVGFKGKRVNVNVDILLQTVSLQWKSSVLQFFKNAYNFLN